MTTTASFSWNIHSRPPGLPKLCRRLETIGSAIRTRLFALGSDSGFELLAEPIRRAVVTLLLVPGRLEVLAVQVRGIRSTIRALGIGAVVSRRWLEFEGGVIS